MPAGATKKEKRQYEKIKKGAKKSGRYGGRAEEVTARTVMKKRRQKGKAKTKTSSGRPRNAAKRGTRKTTKKSTCEEGSRRAQGWPQDGAPPRQEELRARPGGSVAEIDEAGSV